PLFDAVLKQSPDNPRALLGQSRCLRRMGKLMEAQAQLEKLLAKHPRHVEGLTERAGIDLFNGKFESAEPLLRKAVELQPHNFQANYHLVICLRRLGRAKETAQATRRMHQIRVDITRFVDLEKSVLEKPGDPAPRCEAGVLLLGLGEQRDGVRWLTSALRVDPRHRPAHKALAEHYERIGKKDLAEKHHRLARE
ncbi:MAG TPA: tetratricopeptide repeat protein, partial [Gemmataceae bacterium]|nr:tetratricopeptide repeat protein [Gemmataceae bacterium]